MNISCLTCPCFLLFNGSSPPLCLCLFELGTFSVEHKSSSPVRLRGNYLGLRFNSPTCRQGSAAKLERLGTLIDKERLKETQSFLPASPYPEEKHSKAHGTGVETELCHLVKSCRCWGIMNSQEECHARGHLISA